VNELVDRITAALEPARDPERAGPMEAYLRHQFPFLGIASPERAALVRAALAGMTAPSPGDVLDAAEVLWTRDEREYQLVAAGMLSRAATRLPAAALPRLGVLITTKSWWDTVDELAIHSVGALVLAHRELVPVIDEWIDDADFWLARTAILHQNRWKAATDQDRLFRYCLRRAGDTEFFIRKAIGWALREHSKTDPGAVARFVADHHDELSGLTRREALKRIERIRPR
jgi:3-methyladenine DNA glycosylase AlkD